MLWQRIRGLERSSSPLSFRGLFASVLGKRRPTVSGTLRVPGIDREVTIRRDTWGIPFIEATDEAHAWFGQGFCQGQDRAFQLEFLRRVGQGTLSEVIGPKGLPIDRLSRRIGFQQSSEEQYAMVGEDVRGDVDAYVRGINAGIQFGLKHRPHELALLRSKPGTFEATDAVNVAKLISFAMASNWDSELARLKVLSADGPEALEALDITYPEWLQVSSEYGLPAGQAADRLAEDVHIFQHSVGLATASNNWVVSAERSASGRPLIAHDPHLPATLPCAWYISHVKTPERTVTGANFVGTPGFAIGYNQFASWGVTAGHIDNSDLFIHEIGPDGCSVRRGDSFLPCQVRTETIKVRGKSPVVEQVLVTHQGPIISPALDGDHAALSLKATWLEKRTARGLLHLHHLRNFDDLRTIMRDWPGVSTNLLYGGTDGEIGWQLAGEAPVRKKGWGTIPLPASDPEVGWEDQGVPFEDMPHRRNPDCGFFATANNKPQPDGEGPFLGADWFEGYRQSRIVELLAERDDWTIEDFKRIQLDTFSVPWREIRPILQEVSATDHRAERALELLNAWDGHVSSDSVPGTVFELFLAEMIQRVVKAKAPSAAQWALGKGFVEIAPQSTIAFRRVGHLVRLLETKPPGWFDRGWLPEISDALSCVVRSLEESHGYNPDGWAWGVVRGTTLIHPVGETKPMDRVFNLGPVPSHGDTNTIHVSGVDPNDPTGNAIGVPTLRMAVEVGAWDNNYWVLAGGQSGNPLSPHYSDHFERWAVGEAIQVPFTAKAVMTAKMKSMTLVPL